MPIEFVFSIVKRKFKQLKTNAVLNRTSVKTADLIRQAFDTIEKQAVRHFIDHCLKMFEALDENNRFE